MSSTKATGKRKVEKGKAAKSEGKWLNGDQMDPAIAKFIAANKASERK